MHILISDDGRVDIAGFARELVAQGASVRMCSSVSDAIDPTRDQLVILIAVKVSIALEELEQLALRSRKPAIIVSPDDDPQAVAQALQNGAADFLRYPASAAEVMARAGAVLRRMHGHSSNVLRVGSLEVDQDNRRVLAGGTPVHLTDNEYAALELLIRAHGSALHRRKLFDNLYGSKRRAERNIDFLIFSLRKKLTLACRGTAVIETVNSCGYRLVGCALADNCPSGCC